MELEHEKQIREAVSLSTDLVRTLQERQENLPRAIVSFGKVQGSASSSVDVMRHMKRVITLVQAALTQAKQMNTHSNERGNSPQNELRRHMSQYIGSESAGPAQKEEVAGAAILDGMGKGAGGRRQLIKWKKTVRVNGDVEQLADVSVWRKYGEKLIHRGVYKKSYYRCRHKSTGCPAQKQVQRAARSDVTPAGYDVTYIHEHTCGSQALYINDNNHRINHPKLITPQGNNQRINPNYARMPCSDSTTTGTAASNHFPPRINYVNINSNAQNLLYINDIASSSSDIHTTCMFNETSVLTSQSLSYADRCNMQLANCSNSDVKFLSDPSSSCSEFSSASAPPSDSVHLPLNNYTFLDDILTLDNL